MEEVAGLEPTHGGFAIHGITNFAIPPVENHFIIIKKMIKGKWQRARDSNPRRREPRRFSKPVHSTNSGNSLTFVYIVVRMVGIEPTLRNRNGILSPTRLPIPPHSHYLVDSRSVIS